MKKSQLLIVLSALLIALGFVSVLDIRAIKARQSVHASGPVLMADPFTKQYIASLDVARVFGRASGCAEAEPKLIKEVADNAISTGLDPRILAATVAVESGCNQWAGSSKGAFGLMQVRAIVWKDTYNFERDYNLLNPHDNIRVGATILAGLVKQYGTQEGLHRYNGTGTNCGTDCDAGYPTKIATLAARR